MEHEKLMLICHNLEQVCARATMEYRLLHPNSNIRFEVYQKSEIYLQNIFTPFNIAEFYNDNWRGNADYMHVPDYIKVMENLEKFPIITAYDYNENVLLGISTMQYNETDNHIDPYFPEMGAKYFSITGILTNLNAKNYYGYGGIGNKIYEIEMLAALQYKMYFADTRIMCVIDCRNEHSINAFRKASERVSLKTDLSGHNLELPSAIVAYYTIRDKYGKLTEAPTLVMELGLSAIPITPVAARCVDYFPSENLNESLLKTVQRTFVADPNRTPVFNPDNDLGGVMVEYVKLDWRQNQLKNFPVIMTNGTEKGNDRVPMSQLDLIKQMGTVKKLNNPRPLWELTKAI